MVIYKKRNSLRFEIVSIILFKMFFLFLLWLICFSNPHSSKLDKSGLYKHLILNNKSNDTNERGGLL